MNRTTDGRFAKAEPAAKPWTILATHRFRERMRFVNRHRNRLFSHVEATRIGFESEAEAQEYLARLPVHQHWCFNVTTA